MIDAYKNFYENLKKNLQLWENTKEQIEKSNIDSVAKYVFLEQTRIIIYSLRECIRKCEENA